jgi:predicted RNA-binding Zn-ribbon protein involved in translation (DUF1610 family)
MNEQKAQVKEQPKERKPRITRTAMNVTFELARESLMVFRELLRTYKEAISDELLMEIHSDKLIIRDMDSGRIKMANYVLYPNMFEEWHVDNKTKYKHAPLPIRIKMPVEDVIYAIEDAGKEAKARFDISLVLKTYSKTERVAVRKPDKCPKCGRPTTWNQLPENKRGKKGNRYLCECGWRGKVRRWERNERLVITEVDEEAKTTIEVEEQTKETYKVTIFKEESPELPPLPIIYYDGNFKLVAKDFKAKLERLRKRTDGFKMIGSEKGLELTGKGDLIDISIRIDKHTDILLDADVLAECVATYSLDEVLSILPKPSVAQIIGIEYKTDMPLKLTWIINSLGTSCTAEFYVAPRISVE